MEENEVKIRDFKVTKKLVEKFGSTPGRKGCEGQIIGARRAHSTECRARMESKMRADEQLAERIKDRDKRVNSGDADEVVSDAQNIKDDHEIIDEDVDGNESDEQEAGSKKVPFGLRKKVPDGKDSFHSATLV